MGKRRTKEQWESLVSEFTSSGLTLAGWCRNNGISKSSIYPYLKHKQEKVNGISQEWGEVTITNPTEKKPITLKVGNISLDIKSNFDKKTLSDILTVVMKLC